MSKRRKNRDSATKSVTPVTKTAIPVTDSAIKEQPAPVRTQDAFMNLLARLGVGTTSQLEGTEYPLTRLSRNYQLMNSLYRSHWIIRRIIDVIPEDMCKNWFTITSQLEPAQIDKFNKINRKIKRKILDALKWGRLYGGAVAIMLIKGHGDKMEEPLDLDDIYPDDFKGLKVYDRWSGVSPGLDLIKDICEDEYGLPEFYQITTDDGTLKVHHSRVLRFTGRDLPHWEKVAEQHWGASEVEHVYDDLKKRDNTSWNIANLVFLANLRVLKMGDMGEMLSVGNEKVQEDMYNTLQAQNWLMNNQGMYLLGKEDGFETYQYNFSGLSDIYENFMLDISGAAEIPATKLFGRAPAGMNSTGESDLKNYYETIEQKQEADLRPIIDKLLPVMCMSLFGAIPDDIDYKFNPISRATDDEKVDLGSKHTTAIIEAYNASLVSQKTAMMELRQLEEKTGMWSNITDEDIDAADDSISPPIEGMTIPNVNFGGDEDEEDGSGGLEAESTDRGSIQEDTKQHK